ncbi:MAG: diaminobutyrate acetyltransferase [Methanocella sp.]|jgi:L-2,4-diaminobutyric acid acetyltransferase
MTQKPLAPSDLTIRRVKVSDIGQVYKLLTANRPYVGLNSRYTYFLLARDFSDTCLVALDGDRVVAFSSGYVPPNRPDTFFSWEVVVDEAYRGNGLQKKLLLQQLRMTNAKYLEGTINPSNHVSEKNFLDLARILETSCVRSVLFSEADFGNDGHEAEVLFRVGPIGLGPLKKKI